MKIWTLSALVLAAIAIALSPVAGTVYGEAFPQDPARRQALDHCAAAEPGFNRLLAASRLACYDRRPTARPSRPPVPGSLQRYRTARIA